MFWRIRTGRFFIGVSTSSSKIGNGIYRKPSTPPATPPDMSETSGGVDFERSGAMMKGLKYKGRAI